MTLKKRRGHKKAIIAIARKMLVSIYHMIEEDEDFQPIDYEQVVTRKHNTKELNLKNIIEFLGEHGVDAETIHMVESQCTGDTVGGKDAEPGEKAEVQKKKQPKPNADPTTPTQETVKRRGRPPKSRQTKDQPLNQPAVATA